MSVYTVDKGPNWQNFLA